MRKREDESNRTAKKGLVERREFLTGAAAALTGASLAESAGVSGLLGLPLASPRTPAPAPEPGPILTPDVERRTRRWRDQRWLLDAVIDTVGVEWDQSRMGGLVGACGPEIQGDVAGIRARVHKFNDLSREIARPAVHREKLATQYEAEGYTVAARENYFMAALLYALAQWPIFEITKENLALNERKNAAYAKYMQYADHEVRRVEVPFGGAGKSLPGYLHLPPNRSGRVPCVWSISGLDSTKEGGSALYGDKLRERGIATLALEGPGQGECSLRGIHLTQSNWLQAAPVVLSWIRDQREIDPDRVALRGVSLGSFLGSQAASTDARLKGCALQAMALEPGHFTSLQTASTTFKLRFMYYSGINDEQEMDKYLQSWNLDGIGEEIRCPYLLVAGEDDQLCPIEYGYKFLDTISAPKQMLVYEGALHAISGSAAVANGPNAGSFIADWLSDRLQGKTMDTKHMKVDASGAVHTSTFAEAESALSISFLS